MSDESPPDTGETQKPPTALPFRPVQLREKNLSITLIVDNSGKFCAHDSAVVGRYQRTVHCAACDATLDPFDVLLRLSQKVENQVTTLQNLKADILAAEKRKAHIERLESNARSRAKRLGVEESKNDLNELLDGRIRCWVTDGLVQFCGGRKLLTPAEARKQAAKIMRVADEAERGK